MRREKDTKKTQVSNKLTKKSFELEKTNIHTKIRKEKEREKLF